MQLDKDRMWRTHDLKPSYDVVIIGAGVHGLATAYYLGKMFGVRKIALLEKSYLGAGASGRNTAILRSNYRTPQGVAFYNASLKLYEQMSSELGWNVLFSQCGHMTLGHTDTAVSGLRVRSEKNQLMGVNSRIIGPAEIQKLVPGIDCSDRPRYPIMAALYHPPGGIIRHDAVVWGYARACDRMGIEIHPYTEATGIQVENGRANKVVTNRRRHRGGRGGQRHRRMGHHHLRHGRRGHANRHAPVASLCDRAAQAVSRYRHRVRQPACLRQSELARRTGHRCRDRSLSVLQHGQHAADARTHGRLGARAVSAVAPHQGVAAMGGHLRYDTRLRPDHRGFDDVTNFYVDVGWGTYGFKAAPAAGRYLAELIATKKVPEVIAPFAPTVSELETWWARRRRRRYLTKEGFHSRTERRT